MYNNFTLIMGKTKQFKHTSRFYKLLKSRKTFDREQQLIDPDKTKVNNVYTSPSITVDNVTQDFLLSPPDETIEASTSVSEELSNPFFEEHDEPRFGEDIFEEDEENESLNTVLNFTDELKTWALNYRINHTALSSLLNILRNNNFGDLPMDSRTLLKTPQTTNIHRLGGGEYWYYGLGNCIRDIFNNKLSIPTQPIIVTINIDGLPTNKSSKHEFWPILCMIETGNTVFEPQVVSIFSGIGKPILNDFLSPFVNELDQLLKEGIRFDNHLVSVQIRGFICDTPARCFIKNISYFNSYHGCSKCLVMGEYDPHGRHMFYNRTDCALRTNESFRKKTDPDHHKGETPLEKLPIDMVSDFPVADSLHLFDLGIMKRCLLAWISGNFGFRAKWSSKIISQVSELLEECNHQMPLEIHRAVRSLDSIKFWKGLEFRTFLLYVGPVVLRDNLEIDIYNHYLTLFCAVTLCSAKAYLSACEIARKLFLKYITDFGNFYGQDSISSNVHNLCHVVDDVKKFGCLPSFSAYPFENKLFQLKSLIRSGNRPLVQVAKRICEISSFRRTHSVQDQPSINYPYVKNPVKLGDKMTISFKRVYVEDGLILASDRNQDKWFMTHNEEIVSMLYAVIIENNTYVKGQIIKNKINFFEQPFNSAHLHIYCSDGIISSEEILYNISDIKCKLIRLKYKNRFVFIPLLHTLDLRKQN